MKYKVGDRVKIQSLDWYNKNKDKDGNIVFSSKVPQFSWNVNVRTVFTKDMVKFCGKVVTIESVWTVNYSIGEGSYRYYFTDEMIEGLVEEETKPNVIEEAKKYWDSIKDAWICPEGYQFKDENGNVINAMKIVLEKKKKGYPKTYEECCEVLSLGEDGRLYTKGYKASLIQNFQKLLICRDAYWKIAGDEMGLGKPWEQDYDYSSPPKYTISCYFGDIIKEKYCGQYNRLLSFPTPEMRDAFYENFNELIEECKDFL